MQNTKGHITYDYPGTFFGYGDTKEDAIEHLKAEVEFVLKGGYKTKNED